MQLTLYPKESGIGDIMGIERGNRDLSDSLPLHLPLPVLQKLYGLLAKETPDS